MKAMRFVAVIPHRDCKPKLDPYKAELFALDFFGAYSFPLAAPLAQVSRPLTKSELKRIALALREATLAHNGKITASGLSVADFPARAAGFPVREAGYPVGLRLLGVELDVAVPVEALPKDALVGTDTFEKPAAHPVPDTHAVSDTAAPPSPVLAAAVIRGEDISAAPPPPSLTFSAASVANIVIRPLSDDGYSFEWKIGIPVWLPSVKKKRLPAEKQHGENRF